MRHARESESRGKKQCNATNMQRKMKVGGGKLCNASNMQRKMKAGAENYAMQACDKQKKKSRGDKA